MLIVVDENIVSCHEFVRHHYKKQWLEIKSAQGFEESKARDESLANNTE